jgi:hypothetical protein
MLVEIVKVIKCFLHFLTAYHLDQVHNTFIVLLELHFKSLYVVENYVGCGDVACFTFEYNVRIIFFLLINVFMY